MSKRSKNILTFILILLILCVTILYFWLKGNHDFKTASQNAESINEDTTSKEELNTNNDTENSNADNENIYDDSHFGNTNNEETAQLSNIEINNNKYLEKYPQIINTYNALGTFDEFNGYQPFYNNNKYILNDYEKTYLVVRQELDTEKYFSITPIWSSIYFRNFKEEENVPQHNLCNYYENNLYLNYWIDKDNYSEDEYTLADCSDMDIGTRVKTLETKKIDELGNNLFEEYNYKNVNNSINNLLTCPFYSIYKNEKLNLVKIYFEFGCGGTTQPYYEHAISNIESDKDNIYVYEKYAYYHYNETNEVTVNADPSSKVIANISEDFNAPGILDLMKTNNNDLKTIKLTFNSKGQFISSEKVD